MSATPEKVEKPKTRTACRDLLSRRITESGLSINRFAAEVLLRPERTVRRWLSSESPVPGDVVDWLVDPWAAPWPRRRRKP